VRIFALQDDVRIETFLRRNTLMNIYQIGDLDPFFRPFSTWYALEQEGDIKAMVLLYTGLSLASVLALAAPNYVPLQQLLKGLIDELPDHFYAHLTPGAEAVLLKSYQLDSHGEHLKMGLETRNAHWETTSPEVVNLGVDDVAALLNLYRKGYPGNWFDQRMLETGKYFGVRRDNQLVAAAGIHVFSARYRVAALGNIVTDPECRGQGLATMVTARLCQELSRDTDHIGLNVKSDNLPAISCYRRLGFHEVGRYSEYMVTGRKTG
jgi:RimJ/RimL family protein N-acetyltransferase